MADIRHRVGIAVPPEEVYAALATVEGLSTWWTRDVDGDPSSGGKLSFRFGGPDTGAVMEVVAAEPERHVGWRCVAGPEEWLGTEITFDLTSSGAMTIILFTLDETTFSRELAPLAGHYPCLRLGPPWWFLDSPEGMMRFRELATETAGFYNTVGFNDDTRAFLSIPARHDVARRVDCAFLARLVIEHRLREDEAFEVAHELTYGLVKKAYRL